MEFALLITQVIATVVIAGTFVVYLLQLRTMHRQRTDQNLLSVASFSRPMFVRRVVRYGKSWPANPTQSGLKLSGMMRQQPVRRMT